MSTSTLLIGYYHGVLMREINADTLVERMATNGMLSTSDQELISIGHCLYQKSLLLLRCVQHMSARKLLEFCELLQEVYPKIGSQLVTGNYVICLIITTCITNSVFLLTVKKNGKNP